MSNKQFLIIDFGASWCGPCKMFAPVFEKVKADYSGSYDFKKVDVDEESDLAQKFNIFSVPTVVAIKDGKEVARVSGYMSEAQFVKFLNEKCV